MDRRSARSPEKRERYQDRSNEHGRHHSDRHKARRPDSRVERDRDRWRRESPDRSGARERQAKRPREVSFTLYSRTANSINFSESEGKVTPALESQARLHRREAASTSLRSLPSGPVWLACFQPRPVCAAHAEPHNTLCHSQYCSWAWQSSRGAGLGVQVGPGNSEREMARNRLPSPPARPGR